MNYIPACIVPGNINSNRPFFICIVLHPAKYFNIYGVKWRQYVTPVVVWKFVLISYWKIKMPIIDSFDVHYRKICWKLQERYICRSVCLYWVYFDRCCPLFDKIVKILKYFMKYFMAKSSWNFTSLTVSLFTTNMPQRVQRHNALPQCKKKQQPAAFSGYYCYLKTLN